MYGKLVRNLSIILVLLFLASGFGYAQENTAVGYQANKMEIHAFYPSSAVFTAGIEKYIEQLDSISFAWSRIYGDMPDSLATEKGLHGNNSFYYPKDFINVVRFAKNKGKQVQLSVYAGAQDSVAILANEINRQKAISAIVTAINKDIGNGEGLFYNGVVIDFEGLKDKAADGTDILYDGDYISSYFNTFLSELKFQLDAADKKLYVAVNPRLYYNGYDYGAIVNTADRMIVMAHDYEPSGRLKKSEVLQYTGCNALNPIDSPAPISRVRQALSDIGSSIPAADMKKVWLQIAFDSAQWRFNVSSIDAWDALDANSLSRDGRQTPLYTAIKNRADNIDSNGVGTTYGYNNELQTPFITYFNKSEKTYNVILYEDSNSVTAKINAARTYGLGGISVWSLGNLADWKDARGKAFHLDVFSTLLSVTKAVTAPAAGAAIKFSNKLVEQAVRDRLGKPQGTVYKNEISNIYRIKLKKGTASLDELKYMPNLEYLDAQDAGISSLKPLSSLTKLRVLYLQRNAIIDISPLKGLKRLEILSLNGNKIYDVGALSGLTGLRELYISENKAVSLYPLRNLTGLRKLYVNEDKISSITYLTGMKNLYELGLEGNTVSNINALSGMKKLKLLNLSNNKITDITALKGLTQLGVLYLQRNSIRSILVLKGHASLKELSLNGNRIADVSPLGGMTGMKKLYLKDNLITDITALKNLKNLEALYLGGNKIKSFSPVKAYYKKLTATDIKID